MKNSLIIQGCSLVRTCYACPEQYDVFFGDFQIGYLRLRHCSFTATYPDVGGITVYKACPKGDVLFEDYERFLYLDSAVGALIAEHNRTVLESMNDFYD